VKPDGPRCILIRTALRLTLFDKNGLILIQVALGASSDYAVYVLEGIYLKVSGQFYVMDCL